uniref:Zinc finger ZPR1-type domain-containing protein n=1 Tax=Caenorhabditis japonica TaxID=281687 RepID=A0A8R1HUH8_CAEJA
MAADSQDIYRNLSADDYEAAPIVVESMCVNCEENGETRIMCTSIPYYKAVILISFECPHCGYKNNEIQSGEAVQEHGTLIVLRVQTQEDLRRQLVKSEYASIEVPELELEIPFKSQPGEVTTVEGVLERVHRGLGQDQEKRRLLDPESAAQIDAYLERINECMQLDKTWTLKLRDPTGNCYIQNPDVRHVDPRCIISHYHRPLVEKKLLALADDHDVEENEEEEADEPAPEFKNYEDAKAEVLHFHTDCPNCHGPTEVKMKPTDIPFFQTVIIMSLACDRCGYKSNEVKSGGAIRDHGCKLTVRIETDLDLARDVLKTDTCAMQIPEIDLEVGGNALCGRFTTIEGLLAATKEQLDAQSSFFMGDSAKSEEKSAVTTFLEKLDDIIALRMPATIILDDPTGCSYVQSLTAPMDDNRLSKEFYTRSYEQNDDLGINDMKVENYGELEALEEEGEEEEEEERESAET